MAINNALLFLPHSPFKVERSMFDVRVKISSNAAIANKTNKILIASKAKVLTFYRNKNQPFVSGTPQSPVPPFNLYSA